MFKSLTEANILTAIEKACQTNYISRDVNTGDYYLIEELSRWDTVYTQLTRKQAIRAIKLGVHLKTTLWNMN